MSVKIIECPRDAMQGINKFIDTETKINYINALLRVGFDTLDCGSFVSPKAIPQLADTAEVLNRIDFKDSSSKLLIIVANQRGADEAVKFSQVHNIGYPLSLSETFQKKKNTNSDINAAFDTVNYIRQVCSDSHKEAVIYLSMGFGNPYGDPWDIATVLVTVEKLYSAGIRIISLSDTVGVANPKDIDSIFSQLIHAYPEIEFGAHFHTTPEHWREKVDAAYKAGCRRFDGALKGYGGCPMAADELTGNMPTELLIEYIKEAGDNIDLDPLAFEMAMNLSGEVFS